MTVYLISWFGLLSLVNSPGEQELMHGQNSRDLSLEISAKWKDLNQVKDNNGGRYGYDRISYYLGFLDGIAGIKPPRWWIEMLANESRRLTDNNRKNELAFDKPGSITIRDGNNVLLIPLPEYSQIAANNDALYIKGLSISIPTRIGHYPFALSGDYYSYTISGDRIYMILYGQITGSYLVCYDKKEKRVIWPNMVLSDSKTTFSGGGRSGYNVMLNSIITSNDNVILYSYSNSELTFNVFNKISGKSVIKFNSAIP